MTPVEVSLRKVDFASHEQMLASFAGMTASSFRYDSGIEALRLSNDRGHLVILPYYGQMIWDAVFDGVDLTMKNMFSQPKPAHDIAGTYGCFAFHSGLLRNGCPSPDDTHALHGEMPVAAMDSAGLSFGEDAEGPYLAVVGSCEYVMGFGDHYLVRPKVVLRPDMTLFDMCMDVENLGGAPMDLMYMCHVNFAFYDGARIVQPAPFTPDRTIVRTAVPGHVQTTPEYLSFIDDLAKDPSGLEVLDEPERYNPEQVLYVKGVGADGDGNTASLMRRREGDGFHIAYNREDFPQTVRWILVNSDQQVAAFALPSTCEPEGYLAEKKKGNVRQLAPGEGASFAVRLGYMTSPEADEAEAHIRSL
ncbi:aldose 1-epimerase family protein [uncultured Cohaesibacter sp.]|uniref:aldose 1-epimerase family protein n=1 Tax=uncultured Cohaesibacter sp. TaxID=1002546 RepID=UPI0029C91C42|nr:aldose 1-epimerase family protein [uncultured Cohaesibacter sp.]